MTKVTQLSLDEGGSLSRKRIHLREISGDADTPLETVGQDLRAARLRRGDDLASVSRALKIRKDHLEALEEDQFEKLPGRAYAIGFVRSYADYLGIDAVICVERFKAEIAGRGEAALPAPSLSGVEEERKLPHGWLVIAAVLLVLIVYGAYRLALSADNLANQPVAAVPQQLAPKVAAAPKPVVRPPAPRQPSAPGATNGTQTGTPPAPETAADQSAQPGTAPPVRQAALPQGIIYGKQNANARVILRIHSATRILVQGGDGRVFINRAVQPGDTYQVPLVLGITLTTPNGSAVELDLDGQSMGMASRSDGMVEALPLDPQSVADHANQAG